MDPDFDKINLFIYNKIDNYNKQFDKFQKNLNIQDNKIRNVCKDKVTETIKKNPKKTAQQFIDLTTMNETDDTSENDYTLEKNDIEDIKKNILNNKKTNMYGGNYDTETDITGEVEIIEEIEVEKEKIRPNYINYTFITNTFIILLFIYVIIFLIMIIIKYPIEYNGIYKPVLILINIISPHLINESKILIQK